MSAGWFNGQVDRIALLNRSINLAWHDRIIRRL
jgi:hypothetical protein